MLVLNPVDKFGLEWCKGYSYLKIFSGEKNISFAPSELVLGMLGWYDYITFTTSPVIIGTELPNYFLTTSYRTDFLPTSQILLALPNKVL
jgi:hypothetical protein